MSDDEDTMLDLDPTCPYCGDPHDVGETYDGHGHDCASCGKHIVAVAFSDTVDGTTPIRGCMIMVRGEPMIESTRPSRQRTRRRWRRQGRRG